MTERATDLIGLLTDAGIRLKRSMAPGSQHKVLCPKCDGGRTHELSLSVHINDDGQGAAWSCKRSIRIRSHAISRRTPDCLVGRPTSGAPR